MKTGKLIGIISIIILAIAAVWYFRKKKNDPSKVDDGPIESRKSTEASMPGPDQPIASRSAVNSPVARGGISEAGFQTPLNASVKGNSPVVELMDSQGTIVQMPATPRTTPVNVSVKGDWQAPPRPNLSGAGSVQSGSANVKVYTKTK